MPETLATLLHAKARGARLQLDYGYVFPDKWRTTKINPDEDSNLHQWRIHPEDQHFRYGPISKIWALSAEARIAGELLTYYTPDRVSGLTIVSETPNDPHFDEVDSNHQCLYLLFVAEELVWEGL